MMLQLADNNTAGLSKGISFKKIGKGVKKVGLSVPRNAFLSLVKLNVHNFATRLNENLKKGRADAIFKKWEKMGGKKSTLKKAIEQGSKKKGLFDLEAEPVTTAGFIASASAVIVALQDFLKKAKDTVDTAADVKQLVKGDVADPTDERYAKYYEPQVSQSNALKYAAVAGVGLFALYFLTKKK